MSCAQSASGRPRLPLAPRLPDCDFFRDISAHRLSVGSLSGNLAVELRDKRACVKLPDPIMALLTNRFRANTLILSLTVVAQTL